VTEDPLVTLLRQGRSFSGRERHCGFLNTGGARRFADISDVSGLSLPEDGTGVAFCDWDHDGDLDLWMANRSGPQVRFFENEADWSGKSVRFLLTGKECNRDAIGARVMVTPSAGKVIVRTLRAGEGYLSQSSKWLHFGIGDDEVAKVEVRWPGGASEEYSGVKAGRSYRLEQGAGAAVEWQFQGEGAELPNPVEQPEVESTRKIVLGIPLPLPSLDYESDSGEEREVFGEPLRRKRGLLVNLWSSDCEPCREELTEFAEAHAKFKAAGLGVLALNVDGLAGGEEGSKRAQKIFRNLRFPFSSGKATTSLVGFLQLTNDELMVAQRPLPVPTSFLIDQNQRLVAIYKGKVNPQEAFDELDRLALPFEERRSGTLPFPGRWNSAPKNFVMLNFAARLFQRGYFDEGNDLVTRYARFLEPQPLFSRVLADAGRRCAEAGRNHEARELFQRSLQLNPRRVSALHGLARVLSENVILENQVEALKFARRAAEQSNFKDSEVLLTLAECLVKSGKQAEADGVVSEALSLPMVKTIPGLVRKLEGIRGR